MVVVDASAAVDFLMRARLQATRLADRLAGATVVYVPELFEIEVLNALRGLERSGRVSGARIEEALNSFDGLRSVAWRHEDLRGGIWRLRQRHSIYDAAYVALAKLLDLPLVTADAKLAKAARGYVVTELFEPEPV